MQSMMKLIAAPAVAALFCFAPSAAQAAKPSPFNGIPVSGVSDDQSVAFNGTMDVIGFTNDAGVLKAIALVSGTAKSLSGATQQITNQINLIPVNIPASGGGFGGAAPTNNLSTAAPSAAAVASCSILHLDLGPLDLNLLGLVVHLNEVVLDISAQPGNGNLLGNLLCAVSNLLNGINLGNILGNAITNALTNLLNNLLTGLGL